MAPIYYILFLVTVFDPGFTYILEGETKTLQWPTAYHLRGDETNIGTGIIKPFEIWYSAEFNRSRVDYYGGTVRHYVYGETEENYGQEFVVYPVTNEEYTNENVCQERDFSGPATNFLGPVTDYEFEGQETYNGQLVDVWKYFTSEEDEKKVEKTLYAYKDAEGFDIPVLREIKVSNLWIGTVKGHIVSRYYDFSEPADVALNYTLDKDCNETEVSSALMEKLHLSSDVDDAFASYMSRHNKNYDDDQELRKEIFKNNWRRVIEHNKKNLGYTLTLNTFSDWTEEELDNLRATRPSRDHVGSVPFPHTEEEVEELVQELPDYYDMRIEGYITSVKNQGSCGSCWAFSTTAAVEGALARSNGGRDLDLAEQSMVDCAWGFDNMGCRGGQVEGSFKYILKHGLPTQMEYGLYLDEMGNCHRDNMTSTYKIKGFAAIPPLSVNAMKVALYKYGPVTVAINANEALMAYNSGIFFDPTCNDSRPNHGVAVVGYGKRDGVDYWIVKNSWGEDWGEDGYILMSATANNCHLLENAYYPIV
ncbi:cathepsin L-like proteinase isoform X1 [Maniola hyperantus]|uniref:cathepsin L-like proteinase isoform X1 n=1 Tax=Aphantopus hyperantus TaxID=2795564 RepID=UPI001567FABA|nr:cathepsin L-like proteinase [Maniola hyperantus]